MSSADSPSKALTYTEYLEIDQLLDLQRTRSPGPEHDEMLFIVIHQVYELWFKQVIHEMKYVQEALESDDLPRALSTLKRILTILKILVAQVDILETMTPMSFNSFRYRLDTASGFQSSQFRQLEFLLGRKSRRMMEHHPTGSSGREALDALYERPTVYDSFLRFLDRRGFTMPEKILNRDVRERPAESEGVQKALLRVYREDPFLGMLCERLVDLDEGLQEWRYRHVKMVERTIGHKQGTGGSAGAEYLKTTLFEPLFPDLWRIRTEL